MGPIGLSNSIRSLSTLLSKLQSGQVFNYAFTIILFATLFIHYLNFLPLNIEHFVIIIALFFLFS